MGIQLHANKEDLISAGFTSEIEENAVWDQDEDGNEFISYYRENVIWTSPCGVSMYSYLRDDLCFDNNHVNHHLRNILDDYKIPYTRG
jgi:hypothetical protein